MEWTSETNYHFRLSAFKDRLLFFYAQNPEFIVPSARYNDIKRAVSSGLQDLSVSRPVERLSWGIRVPGDDSQTIYVWLDALINYLTTARYPFQEPGQESRYGWPADCHVVGKDIVRSVTHTVLAYTACTDTFSFHCIYWPAFLMALDLPLPHQVLTHAHWTLGHEKMSKSTGNVVNPFFALDRFGVDTMRYYLAYDGGLQDDADYGNEHIIERYSKGLKNGLGNLASRIVRGKGWDVRRAVAKATSGPLKISGHYNMLHLARISRLPEQVSKHMERLDIGAALKTIMSMIFTVSSPRLSRLIKLTPWPQTNQYMQNCAPWDLVVVNPFRTSNSTKSQEDEDKLDTIIYLCAESLRVCGILLQPYMPGKMEKLLDMLGVQPDARKFENTLHNNRDYGTSNLGLGRGIEGVLFPPLRSDN